MSYDYVNVAQNLHILWHGLAMVPGPDNEGVADMEATIIKRILTGSATPATALLAAVRNGDVTYDAAASAFSERIGRLVILSDAAQFEVDFQRYNDI